MRILRSCFVFVAAESRTLREAASVATMVERLCDDLALKESDERESDEDENVARERVVRTGAFDTPPALVFFPRPNKLRSPWKPLMSTIILMP